MTSLYSRAVARIAGQCVAQIATIDRHRDSIDRIEALAASLRAAGIDATATIDRTGSLEIIVTGNCPEVVHAIEKTGHTAIHNPDGTILVLPPDSLVNALPATVHPII